MQPTIKSLLQDIELQRIALPEVQREFVWSENQAKDLLDSLYKGFPVGYIYLWHPRGTMPSRQVESQSALSREPEWYILDGQQRLTSLEKIKAGEVRVYFHIDNEQFQLENSAMKSNPKWISVERVWQRGSVEISRSLRERLSIDMDEVYERYMPRITRLDQILDRELPIHEIREDDYAKIAEIYIRLNSKGTRLKKAELYLALAVLNIPTDFRAKLDTLEEEFEDWELDPNFFMRCFTCLATGQAKFEAIRQYVREKSKAEVLRVLDDIQKYLRLALGHLSTQLGITPEKAKELLPSEVALVPLVAFLHARAGEIRDDKELSKLVYWFLMASFWGRYSGSTESALDEDLRMVNSSDPIAGWIQNIIAERGKLTILESDLSGKYTKNKLLMLYYLAQHNQGLDWFNGTDLKNTEEIQFHHIFPKKILRSIMMFSDNEVNDVRNIALISGIANRTISAKRPSQYFGDISPDRLRSQLVPADHDLWDPENYSKFLAERGTLLVKTLNEELSILYDLHGQQRGAEIVQRDNFESKLRNSSLRGSESGNLALAHALEVVKEMKRGVGYAKACRNVGSTSDITEQTVRATTTRDLGISKEEFVLSLDDGTLRSTFVRIYPFAETEINHIFDEYEETAQSNSQRSTTDPRWELTDFESKIKRCSPTVRQLAFELDRLVRGIDSGVEYYPHSHQLRYTHHRFPTLGGGRFHPFVHIDPGRDSLVVHVDQGVVDPRQLTRPREADSRFKKQFDINSTGDLDEYRIGLIRESLGICLKLYSKNSSSEE